MRTILFTGKGGVGKTTLAAATALRSASLGHRTLVISTDIAHTLAEALATPLGNEPRPVNGSLEAAELDTGGVGAWGDVKRRIATLLRQEVEPPPRASWRFCRASTRRWRWCA